jgi:hypothetical protein
MMEAAGTSEMLVNFLQATGTTTQKTTIFLVSHQLAGFLRSSTLD